MFKQHRKFLDLQFDDYKTSVLPKDIINRVAIEMSIPFGWHKYIGPEGRILSID